MKRDAHAVPEVKKVARKKVVTRSLKVSPKKTEAKTPLKSKKTLETAKVPVKPKKVQSKSKLTRVPGVIVDASESKKTKAQNDSEVVMMPTSASLRVLEKIEIYKAWYQLDFPYLMSGVAKKSGYLLLLVGAFTALGVYMSGFMGAANLAATVCAEGVACVEIDDEDVAATAPKVEFLNSLPPNPKTDLDITLRSSTELTPAVTLHNLNLGTVATLEPKEVLTNGEFRYLIELSKLRPGSYEMRAAITTDSASYSYAGPVFVIEGLDTSEVKKQVTVTTATSSEMSDLETASTTVPTTVDFDDSEESAEMPISLKLKEYKDSVFAVIKTGTHAPALVSVYAKSNKDSEPLLLGAATAASGEWLFNLSALDLPESVFAVYASFTVNGRTYQTNAGSYTALSSKSPSLTSDSEIKLLVNKINLNLETSAVNNESRKSYFSLLSTSTPDLFTKADEEKVANLGVINELDESLIDNEFDINRLLYIYGLIYQGGSLAMLDLAAEQIKQEFNIILGKSEENSNTSLVNSLLEVRVSALLSLVREQEDVVSDNTNSLTNTDTDADGLSDFDELANIGTDPALADTDNDGVLDSVEFIYGDNPLATNPLNIKTEAEVGGISNDALVSIRRVFASSLTNGSGNHLYPTVVGTAIPNSYVFVSLNNGSYYGIARVSPDGTFYHTIEQPLVNGTHTAVSGYIDTTGKLAIAGRPYEFRVEEDKLVAGVLFGNQTPIILAGTDSNVPYVVSAAVLLAALGFFLIMLADGLLTRRRGHLAK